MPSRSELESHSRLILGLGMMALGAVWLLRLLWPLLLLAALGGLFFSGYWLLQRQQEELVQQQRREDRLARKFYELLDYRQGRISSLEFAMCTRSNGREAQRYLHTQAQAFGGFFERTIQGDVVYIFNPAVIYSYPAQRPATPTELAQAYTAQAQAYKAQAKSQAVWANALRQRNTTADGVTPTVRGQAHRAENVQTIDVIAANE